MKTKDQVLETLLEHESVYLSGQEIAQRLNISRAAVWKAVKKLQTEGYSIDAVTHKGYMLFGNTDRLSCQGIRRRLRPELSHIDISILPAVTSSNTLLRERAGEGASEWTLLLAEKQTAGRGRKGRSFFSPKDTGLYMSLLLRPKNDSADQAVRITTIAAVAVCEAIEEISGKRAEIKWVNDIFLDGKKICGILTEGAVSFENSQLEYAVLGIGMNLYQPKEGFPQELSSSAEFLFSETQKDGKNRIVSAFMNRFYEYYSAPFSADCVKRYRDRSFVIGKQVLLRTGNQLKEAFVLGIDNECRLLVEYSDGAKERCHSGEIQLLF